MAMISFLLLVLGLIMPILWCWMPMTYQKTLRKGGMINEQIAELLAIREQDTDKGVLRKLLTAL